MTLPNVPLVTVDTNVYVSGTTVSASPPGRIIRAWEERKINLALSEAIISEIRDVLIRPYFTAHLQMSTGQIDQYINDLRLGAIVVPGATEVNICRDPKDNMVFSCALEAKANFIVSGDKDILEVKSFQGIPVKSPKDFVEGILETKN